MVAQDAAQLLHIHGAAQSVNQSGDSAHKPTGQVWLQRTTDGFDFRKFWHDSESTETPSPELARTTDLSRRSPDLSRPNNGGRESGRRRMNLEQRSRNQ